MKMSKRVLLLNVVYIAILLGLTATLFTTGRKTINLFEELYNNQFIPLDRLRRIQIMYREIEFRMMGTMADLVAPIGSGEHMKNSIKKINETWDEITKKKILNKYESEKNTFLEGHKGFLAISPQFLKAYFDEDRETIANLYDTWLDYKPKIFKSIDTIVEKQGQGLSEYYQFEMKSTTTLLFALITGTAIVIIILVPFAIMIIRSITKVGDRINEAAQNVATGSQQVSQTSQQVANGASSQASSTEEMASVVTELASQSKLAEENADKVKELSSKAQEKANLGTTNMNEMSSAIAEISDSSHNIMKIMKTIDEIAFQTNLLALNAAVEAARAGSHGRGFAVVAEEVNNLSKRSAQAARETADIIEESIHKIDQGKSITEKTQKSFEEILSVIREISLLSDEISSANNEQVRGISQVETGIQQIDKITQQNASIAEENASSSGKLKKQALDMQQVIAKYLARKDILINQGEKSLIPLEGYSPKELKQRKNDEGPAPDGILIKSEDII